MLYHECKASHPGDCKGCTLDTSKHGKPVVGGYTSLNDAHEALTMARLDWVNDDEVFALLGRTLTALGKARDKATQHRLALHQPAKQ